MPSWRPPFTGLDFHPALALRNLRGHNETGILLAILVAFAGLKVLERLGAQLERQATFLLIAFGFVYLIWGLRRTRIAGGPPAVPPAAGRRLSRRNVAAEPAAEQPARPPALP